MARHTDGASGDGETPGGGEAIALRAVFCAGVPRLLRLGTPTGAIAVRPGQPDQCHAVIGPVDEICTGDFEPLTSVGRVDWNDPDRIPPVLAPASLPPGAGTGLLNTLAARAGGPLRYRGPYPTAALYQSLRTCFHPSAPLEIFIDGVEEAAAAGRAVEPDVWFEPAPFVRYRTGRVTAELRGEPAAIEAIYIDGARFERGARMGRRVLERSDGAVAAFEVPGHPARELVSVDPSGAVTSAVAGREPAAGGHLGQPLPGPVAAAVFASASAVAPALLRPAIAAVASRGLVWADTGWSLVSIIGDRGVADRVAVHAALATGELAPAEMLVALVEHAVPVVLRLAQRELSP